jgi:hypothetical protein
MKHEQKPNAFTIPVRIYYEDTDAGGVVYYANYLKFFERCRTEWLREIGHQQADLLRDPGIAFVVRSCQRRVPEAGTPGRSTGRRPRSGENQPRADLLSPAHPARRRGRREAAGRNWSAPPSTSFV